MSSRPGQILAGGDMHVSGVLFNSVGDLAGIKDWAEGGPEKIALHALVGGSVAEAMGGDFRTGALAAGANEDLVENGHANPVLSTPSRNWRAGR